MPNSTHRSDKIQAYRQRVQAASKEHTKKELFKDLLNRLYSDVPEILSVVDSISAGAESTILNIPRQDRMHRGSADTLYNTIIIEFENNLKATEAHAKEQLAGYLLGKYHSGDGYNFTLIASDFIHWKVFVPDVESLARLSELHEHELILNEVKDATFTLGKNNSDDFYYWLDRFLFTEEKTKATLSGIEQAFGHESQTFINSYLEILKVFREALSHSEVAVAYEQWRKFLSIAYGSFNDSESSFAIHTYLSIISKVLGYEVLTSDPYIDDEEMKGILSGSIFLRFNIQNFVDTDFYHWVHRDPWYRQLKPVLRRITQTVSGFDFQNVDQDILKGVYQELIDLDTRHALGEYYTPDWLCEKIAATFTFRANDRILDPSCGSGSFLRACIARMRELHPTIAVEDLADRVTGIDIHPLSVQISKTTMLLALGKDVINARRPIHLNVLLANTLLAPKGVSSLFGGEFRMQIDQDEYLLNTQIFDDVQLFDTAVSVCDQLADQTVNRQEANLTTFTNALRKAGKGIIHNDRITQSFFQVYKALRKAKEERRDSIWKFIVQNLYKPYFLQGAFDYVLGNPPWFTFNSIRNKEYQSLLIDLAARYNVKPAKASNMAQMEIAAIFMAHCTNYFLNETGKLAFVTPRSFFSADHHANTREGKVEWMRLTSTWDLVNVKPLFRVPASVLFTERAVVRRGLPSAGAPGLSIAGTLPGKDCTLDTAVEYLSFKSSRFYLAKQGQATAITTQRRSDTRVNPYKSEFKLGATLFPRNFYFVELMTNLPAGARPEVVSVKTCKSILPESKKPWKDIELNGRIESEFVYCTALAKGLVPFACHRLETVVLPLRVDEKRRSAKLLSPDELRAEGYLHASAWFAKVEEIWSDRKTERAGTRTANGRIDYQRGLSSQNFSSKYCILYNTSGKDANAALFERHSGNWPFVVDYKNFVFYTDDAAEAHYLCGMLNSAVLNARMKDFQSRGLFGARDVSKKILDIYFPRFNKNDELHRLLSEMSDEAHASTLSFFVTNQIESGLGPRELGKLRLAVKGHLAASLKEIDKLVSKIIR